MEYSTTGQVRAVLSLNASTRYMPYVPVVVTQGDLVLRLKATTEEEDTKGRVKVEFLPQASVERPGVFGPSARALTLDLSTPISACKIASIPVGNTSYSPRIAPTPNLGLTFRLAPYQFISCVPLVNWYESARFKDNSDLSGGVKTETLITELLDDCSFMSYNEPFGGGYQVRKMFAKNVSGKTLGYIHFGVEYPDFVFSDMHVIAFGTDSDTWGQRLATDWVGTGLVLNNIPTGTFINQTVEVKYSFFAQYILWEGLLVKLTDCKGNEVYCRVMEVTPVDFDTSLVVLSAFTSIEQAFVGGRTQIVGLKTIRNVAPEQSVALWLYNYLPPTVVATSNRRVRIVATGST